MRYRFLVALKTALPADTVIYCDPPYVYGTRAHQRRFYYDHEMTDADHSLLLSVLKGLQCHVLLSGYPSELYSSQLQDWRCCSYQAITRGGKRTECLWCNFEQPEELHDWRYAGSNFRQRCALKRLATRWLARLDGMDARQRGYVLDAVHQRYPQRWASAVNVKRWRWQWGPARRRSHGQSV